METLKRMSKQVLLLQKTPVRLEVMPLANGNNVFKMHPNWGCPLPPVPSLGTKYFVCSLKIIRGHPHLVLSLVILPCSSSFILSYLPI